MKKDNLDLYERSVELRDALAVLANVVWDGHVEDFFLTKKEKAQYKAFMKEANKTHTLFVKAHAKQEQRLTKVLTT